MSWQKIIVTIISFLWIVLGAGSYFIDNSPGAALIAFIIGIAIFIYGVIIIKEYE